MSSAIKQPLLDLLDEAYKYIVARQGFKAFSLLQTPLRDLYMHALLGRSEAEFIGIARNHPIYQITQEDPYTKRCNDKPRGYAGDAVMLDYVYERIAPQYISELGQHWFDFTTVGTMSLSVRYWRSLLQSTIDDTISRNAGYQILSVASGHCRELDNSLVLNQKFSGKFVALDQDLESCEYVSNEYAANSEGRIEVCNQSVRTILKNGLAESQERFHLIYSAGLYDYLDDRTAALLTSSLMKMLRPDGQLLIANFVPESESRGYAAAFMDWHLIYRTPAQLAAAFGNESVQVATQLDPHRNVVYASYYRPQ
jgi:extracellular factor (EF) 3-hydroxypalmitic acid methyl ester biosynthesis protein